MYNKVILIGRLTATPEMVKTASDRSFTRVTVAVNRRYKMQNGEREADFITVVVWGRLAETLASYASKGSLISLDGEIRTRKYDKDGQTHYVTEVLCSSFQLLESRAQRAVRENNPDNDLADFRRRASLLVYPLYLLFKSSIFKAMTPKNHYLVPYLVLKNYWRRNIKHLLD